jgi:hypothetical protein
MTLEHGAGSEDVQDRLVISLACGIGTACEEVENAKLQILAIAKERGLLIETSSNETEDEIPHMPPKGRIIQMRSATLAFAFTVILGILGTLFFPPIQVLWATQRDAEKHFLANGPQTVNRVVRNTEGRFFLITTRRTSPGVPYSEWLSQREIAEADVSKELERIR